MPEYQIGEISARKMRSSERQVAGELTGEKRISGRRCSALLMIAGAIGMLSGQSVPGDRIQVSKRLALVIGNSAYRSRLKSPQADALKVTTALRKLGFVVVNKNDLSRREMQDAVET